MPGCNANTMTPWSAHATASASTRRIKAVLAREVAVIKGQAVVPVTLAMSTTLPAPRASMPGSTAWVQVKAPRTLDSMHSHQAVGSTSHKAGRPGSAGIVDQQLDRAEVGLGLSDSLRDAGAITHIGRKGQRPTAVPVVDGGRDLIDLLRGA